MTVTLTLQIANHRFKVRVEEDEKQGMIDAARRVEQLLGSTRTSVADGERAALMVALQLAVASSNIDSKDLDQINKALDRALAVK